MGFLFIASFYLYPLFFLALNGFMAYRFAKGYHPFPDWFRDYFEDRLVKYNGKVEGAAVVLANVVILPLLIVFSSIAMTVFFFVKKLTALHEKNKELLVEKNPDLKRTRGRF